MSPQLLLPPSGRGFLEREQGPGGAIIAAPRVISSRKQRQRGVMSPITAKITDSERYQRSAPVLIVPITLKPVPLCLYIHPGIVILTVSDIQSNTGISR